MSAPVWRLQLVHAGGGDLGDETDRSGRAIADVQGAGGDGVELGVGEPEGVDTIRTAQVDVRSMLKVSRNATSVPAFTVAPVAISMLSPFSRAPVAPVTFAPALNCTAKSAAPTDPATRSAGGSRVDIGRCRGVDDGDGAVRSSDEDRAGGGDTVHATDTRESDVIDIVEGEEGARHRHVRRQIGDVVVAVQPYQPDIVQAQIGVVHRPVCVIAPTLVTSISINPAATVGLLCSGCRSHRCRRW